MVNHVGVAPIAIAIGFPFLYVILSIVFMCEHSLLWGAIGGILSVFILLGFVHYSYPDTSRVIVYSGAALYGVLWFLESVESIVSRGIMYLCIMACIPIVISI